MSLRLAFGCLLLPQAECAVQLVSCAYGISQCIGLKDDDGLEKAKELGCPTSEDGKFFGQTVTAMQGSLSSRFAFEGSESTEYQDGMPCTFTPDSPWEELDQLKLDDIVIEFTDGTTTKPTAASWNPATESNELKTLLTLGHYGFSKGNKTMKSVSVKGSSYTGQGIGYKDVGMELAYARWWEVEEHKELEGSGDYFTDLNRGPTHCGHEFSETTHLIQVVLNGGQSVTFEGNKELSFDLDQRRHKQMFKIFHPDGTELPADKFLGLADEADGDNFLDLCMKLTADDVKKFQGAGSGATVRLLSTRKCSFLVLPKGDCQNELVGDKCGDSAARSQEICVTEIPDAQVKCDPMSNRVEFKDLTEAEVGALNEADCKFITPEKSNPYMNRLILQVVLGGLLVLGCIAGGIYYACKRRGSGDDGDGATQLTAS